MLGDGSETWTALGDAVTGDAAQIYEAETKRRTAVAEGTVVHQRLFHPHNPVMERTCSRTVATTIEATNVSKARLASYVCLPQVLLVAVLHPSCALPSAGLSHWAHSTHGLRQLSHIYPLLSSRRLFSDWVHMEDTCYLTLAP